MDGFHGNTAHFLRPILILNFSFLLTFGSSNFQLQLTCAECIALIYVARLITAAKPADALFGRAVRE